MTDCWGFGATLFAGIITAAATFGAVVYSNRKTRQQFLQDKEDGEKKNKYVVIKPTMLINTFAQVTERIIMSNDYNRKLLFSGKDGFAFYDDKERFVNEKQRILLIENNSISDIKNIRLHTESTLIITDTNEKFEYETDNNTGLLRSKESILIRMLNKEQFDHIVSLNKEKKGSDFTFCCRVEYETYAKQKIVYLYELNIRDDKSFEVIKDGVESVVDIDSETQLQCSRFRNIQDSLCGLDRNQYVWTKMGMAMTQGALPIMQQAKTEQSVNNGEQNLEKDF